MKMWWFKKPGLILLSAFLGIAVLTSIVPYWIGFIFLFPLFYFFYQEDNFWKIFSGVLLFRISLSLGTVIYTLEPLTWTLSILIFSGLGVAVYFSNHILKNIFLRLSSFAVWYFVFDFLQAEFSLLPTYIITVGNIFADSPFLGLARFGGLMTLETFALIVNIVLLWIFLEIMKKPKVHWKIIGFSSTFLIAFLMLGWQQASKAISNMNQEYETRNRELTVTTMAMSNSASLTKEISEFAKYIQSDLVLLPEGIFANKNNDPLTMDKAADRIKSIGFDAKYISGTFNLIDSNKVKTNSMLILDDSGAVIDRYDKVKLTIMGEYWPFEWHPSFYDYFKNDPTMKNYAIFKKENNLKSGSATKTINVDGKFKLGPLICVENHYPGRIMAYNKQGIDFIVNSISNRWLGDGNPKFNILTIKLYKIESVQSGLPIAVSSISGFGGFFFPDGRIDLIDSRNGSQFLEVELKY